VAHVDEQDGEIAARPEEAGQHEQPTHFGEERGNRGAAHLGQSRHDFGDEQQHQDERHQAKELRHVPQPNVRLEVGRANLHDGVSRVTAVCRGFGVRRRRRSERGRTAVLARSREVGTRLAAGRTTALRGGGGPLCFTIGIH
jgi:hypothetical protein